MTLPDDLYDEYLPPPPTLAGLRRVIEAVVQAATADIDDHVLAIEEQLTVIGEKMAKYREEIDAINAATSALSARVDAVIERANLDDPEVEAELRAISAALDGMAADPENPVPPVEPTPEPAPDQPA